MGEQAQASAPLVQLGARGSLAPLPARLPPAPEEGDPALRRALEEILPKDRVLTRWLERISCAADASFYRLVPQAVVRPVDEGEVSALFKLSQRLGIPLTFRAGGTSLSGQSVSDGILVDIARHFTKVEVLDEGRRVRSEPGVIGGRINALLRPWGRRIGPDPASIDACRIGGILSNNASGMCCGIEENAYRTVESIRFVLPSGLVLDTARPEAGEVLRASAPAIAEGLLDLKRRLLADAELAERIRERYTRKNTTGYGLNAFLDHQSPEQILAHLLIGGEGTLAFISETVLRTVADPPAKLTAFLLFKNQWDAFSAVEPLSKAGAKAVEFIDWAGLRSVKDEPALGVDVDSLPAGAAALLVEWQCSGPAELADARIDAAAALDKLPLVLPPKPTSDAVERAGLWKIRKGLYPAVGATRPSGTTVIIEDVVFPLPRLAQGTADLRAFCDAHGYPDAIIFGHARDGNVHFVLAQGFNDPAEIERYDRFMKGLVDVVVTRHGGALKGEHGTGRNVAPFVEAEWGRTAMGVMRDLKKLVDPSGLLNPGVIVNPDPRAHLADLKTLPTVEGEVDRCVECGFCEAVCPSRGLTLTPRQRIVVRRELARKSTPSIRAALQRDFDYAALDTCATDGMCATACPVHIDTGTLVKRLRRESNSDHAKWFARTLADNASALERALRLALRLGQGTAGLLGHGALDALSRLGSAITGLRLPRFSPALSLVPRRQVERPRDGAQVVYVPSCLSRIMGRPRGEEYSLPEVILRVADRAEVKVFTPKAVGLCCGLPWGSKGFSAEHGQMAGQLVDALWEWTSEGALPAVIDASSCLQGLRYADDLLQGEQRRRLRALKLQDGPEFARDTLLPRLKPVPVPGAVALHPNCAAVKLGTAPALEQVARACAGRAVVPSALGCCGTAGDRGLSYPELPASATLAERTEVERGAYTGFYSSNLTCETGLRQATGQPYRSVFYLLDEATDPGRRQS